MGFNSTFKGLIKLFMCLVISRGAQLENSAVVC